ncbi:MAG: DNA recombination protein RmuC, partial [Gammaproteobacteria bacterium]|nr:DNA recombination protein RmuC [Gammaproteobacteria bacterium]
QEMFTRLTTFAEHLAKLGRSLDSSVSAYNKAVSSYDSRVLPGARKFTELGISTKKEPPKLEQVEHMARQVESREDKDTTH